MIRTRTLVPLLAAALLAACAPSATTPGKATASTTNTTVSFYPAQGGLVWQYVPDGEALNNPYSLTALGPTLFGDQTASAFRLSGRGADQTWYRQISDGGTLLLGFTKPGLTVNLTPAWREAPATTAWRVGASWTGSSKVQVIDAGKVVQEGTANYKYTVLEQRQVNVGSNAYTVYVVNRQIDDTLGGLFPASQNYWFAPYIGEVRTPEGLLLVARNYKGG